MQGKAKDLESLWKECCKVLDHFLRNRDTRKSKPVLPQKKYLMVCNTIYKKCTDYSNRVAGEDVYKKFVELLEDLLRDLRTELEDTRGIFKIKKLAGIWKEYLSNMDILCRLFREVNRSYVEQNHLVTLEAKGVELFKVMILTGACITDMEEIFFEEMQAVRESNSTTSIETLREFVETLTSQQHYQSYSKNVEKLMEKQIECSHKWFCRLYKGAEKLACIEFYAHAQRIYETEVALVVKCFGSAAFLLKRIREDFFRVFIQRYRQDLIKERQFESMLLHQNTRSLRRICEVSEQWEDFNDFRGEFEKFVERRWTDCLQETIAAAGFLAVQTRQMKRLYVIHKILEHNSAMLQFVTDCMAGLPLFLSSYKKISERVLSNACRDDYDLSELLLFYWGKLVSSRILTPDEFSCRLARFMDLFDFLTSKSPFLTAYGQDMALRMMNKGKIEVEREKLLIKQLIEKCGESDAGYLWSLMASHDENERNAPMLLEETRKRKQTPISLQLFKEECWVFRRLVPDTSSSEHLFIVEEALVEQFVKRVRPDYKYYFDRLLGYFTLEYRMENSFTCSLLVSDLQAYVVMYLQKEGSGSLLTLQEKLKSFNKNNVVEEQISLLTNGELPLLKRDETGKYTINQELQTTPSATVSYTRIRSSMQKGQAAAAVDDLRLRVWSYQVRRMKQDRNMEFEQLVEETQKGLHRFNPDPNVKAPLIQFIRACIHKLVHDGYFEKDNTNLKYVTV